MSKAMAPDIIHGPQVHQTRVWEALASLLPSQGPDCDYWWKLTGKHLASMVDAAGYSTERQYEALLFHYHWMVSEPSISPTVNASSEYIPGAIYGSRTREWGYTQMADSTHG